MENTACGIPRRGRSFGESSFGTHLGESLATPPGRTLLRVKISQTSKGNPPSGIPRGTPLGGTHIAKAPSWNKFGGPHLEIPFAGLHYGVIPCGTPLWRTPLWGTRMGKHLWDHSGGPHLGESRRISLGEHPWLTRPRGHHWRTPLGEHPLA